MFTFNPLLAGLAAVCLVCGLIVGAMGLLTLRVMRPTRLTGWLRLLVSIVALTGICIGMVGLYVAL